MIEGNQPDIKLLNDDDLLNLKKGYFIKFDSFMAENNFNNPKMFKK